jgi:hypothetical protein
LAGLCPGNNESAGKQKAGKTRPGNRWLRAALGEAALGAIRKPNSASAARYRRTLGHRGHKKAVIAVAHVGHRLGQRHIITARIFGASRFTSALTERARRIRAATINSKGDASRVAV